MEISQLDNVILELKNICKAKDITISVAESCTGGLLSHALTKNPGSSSFFECGYVTYSNSSKISLLNVSLKTIEKFGAVSEETAREMAIGAVKNSTAKYSVSITGIAGPGNVGVKPEGLVCFGIAKNYSAVTRKENFGSIGRDKIRLKSCIVALNILTDYIKLDHKY